MNYELKKNIWPPGQCTLKTIFFLKLTNTDKVTSFCLRRNTANKKKKSNKGLIKKMCCKKKKDWVRQSPAFLERVQSRIWVFKTVLAVQTQTACRTGLWQRFIVCTGETWKGARVKWKNGNEIKWEDCMFRYDGKLSLWWRQGTVGHISALWRCTLMNSPWTLGRGTRTDNNGSCRNIGWVHGVMWHI